MAKRQANGATNSLDKKFEIDTDTFVVSMDIFWYTSENTMAIIQQKKGSACSLTNIINSWRCYREGERNTQHGTDAHT